MVIFDELAQWAKTAGPRRLFDALATAAPKTGGRLIAISTSGSPEPLDVRLARAREGGPLWRLSETIG